MRGTDKDEDRTQIHQGRQGRLRRAGFHHHHVRDSQSGWDRCVQAGRCRSPAWLEPGCLRRHRAEVFPQGRCSRASEEGARKGRSRVPVAFGSRRQGAGSDCPRTSASAARPRAAGLRPSGRGLGLLGLEGWLFHHRIRCARLLRRDALHAGHPARRAEQPAVVQHRPALGLRHRRPGTGPLLRRLQDRRADQIRSRPTSIRSRTPASSSPSPTIW